MGLVDEQPVNAELFKGHNVVLARPVVELIQPRLQRPLGALQLLDAVPLRAAGPQFLDAFLDLP